MNGQDTTFTVGSPDSCFGIASSTSLRNSRAVQCAFATLELYAGLQKPTSLATRRTSTQNELEHPQQLRWIFERSDNAIWIYPRELHRCSSLPSNNSLTFQRLLFFRIQMAIPLPVA